MDRLCARIQRRLNNDITAQITVRWGIAPHMNRHIRHLNVLGTCIHIRMHSNTRHSHRLGRLDDATGNLAAVGYQDFVKHQLPSIPRTGKASTKAAACFAISSTSARETMAATS